MKSTPIITTRSGRRFAICPGCTAVQAPVALGATQLTCAHCGGEFGLREPRKREPKWCSDADPTDSPPNAQP